MPIVVLDTDAASRLFERQLPGWALQTLQAQQLAITFVTLAEVVYGTSRRGWGPRRVTAIEQYYQRTFGVLPTRSDHLVPIARTWGALRAEAERDGFTIPANDAWIAACCITFGYGLLTLNRKHFEPLASLAFGCSEDRDGRRPDAPTPGSFAGPAAGRLASPARRGAMRATARGGEMAAGSQDRTARVAGALGGAVVLAALGVLVTTGSRRGLAALMAVVGLAAGYALASAMVPAGPRRRSPVERVNDGAFVVVVAAVSLLLSLTARPWTAALPALAGGAMAGVFLRRPPGDPPGDRPGDPPGDTAR